MVEGPQRHPGATSPTSVEERRTRLARLVRTMDRPTLGVLAAQLNVSMSTIRKDMKAVRREWRQERMRDWQEHLDEELAKLDLAEQEAWRAVAVAQRPRTMMRRVTRPVQETTPTGDTITRMRVTEEIEVVEPEGGTDLAALGLILKVMERRAKMLGLDAPDRVEVTEPGTKRFIFTLKLGDAVIETPTSAASNDRLTEPFVEAPSSPPLLSPSVPTAIVGPDGKHRPMEVVENNGSSE